MFSTCICKDNDSINLSIVLSSKTLYFEFFDFIMSYIFLNFPLQYYLYLY